MADKMHELHKYYPFSLIAWFQVGMHLKVAIALFISHLNFINSVIFLRVWKFIVFSFQIFPLYYALLVCHYFILNLLRIMFLNQIHIFSVPLQPHQNTLQQ